MVPRLRALFHVHTDYSFDSNISLERLVRFCRSEGIRCVAVTDHDTIAGAQRLRAISDLKVIVGEEISTSQGHLIGLFLQRHVPPGMSARDTALAIKAQGGLVLLPHPFVRAFGCGLRGAAYAIADLVDAVEVNNAQNCFDGPDRAARRFAEAFGLPPFVGADSHMASSIAPCWQEMDDFDGPGEFLSALRGATLHPGRHGPGYIAATAWRLARYHLGLPLPPGFGVNVDGTGPGRSTVPMHVHAGASCG